MSKQLIAIANCRVSSDEQLKNNSLNRQRDAVFAAAERLDAVIPKDGWWSGSVSSKKGGNLKRKDIQQMFAYCDKNKNVKYLIVDEPDRFMRSIDEAMYLEMEFKLRGVRVWYASDEVLNSDDMTAKLMKFMKYFVAEGSNEERQRKSIAGQTKALQEGRYTFVPKPGYVKGYRTGIPEIDPIKGPALKKILLDIAYGRTTPSQGLIELNKSDFMVDGHSLYKMDKFRNIATDGFYAGIILMDKQIKVRNENGLHDRLITIEEHQILVEIFANKRKNQKGPRKNGNPLFPVSNKVNCEICKDESNGRYVGLELHNGKDTGKIYRKYRCRACKRYISKDDMHSEIERQFLENPITPEGKKDMLDAISIVWKREEHLKASDMTSLKGKIKAIEESIRSRALAAIDPSNAIIKGEVLAVIEKDKQQLKDLETQLAELDTTAESDKQEFLEFAYDFIDKMGMNFLDFELVSPENRERCKQVVFPSGFYVDENNRVYTPEISILYGLAGTKKDPSDTEKSSMVRVKRL